MENNYNQFPTKEVNFHRKNVMSISPKIYFLAMYLGTQNYRQITQPEVNLYIRLGRVLHSIVKLGLSIYRTSFFNVTSKISFFSLRHCGSAVKKSFIKSQSNRIRLELNLLMKC